MADIAKIKGFSLVELSVVLTVIGITLAGALELATKKTEDDKKNETEDKIAAIEQAMDVYLSENMRIPCPADGDAAIDSADFGAEDVTQGTGCNSGNFSAAVGDGIRYGVVPVVELGLSDDYMFDGWDRRMSYGVDVSFTANHIVNTDCDGEDDFFCFKYGAAGQIVVNDDADEAIIEDAVYIIISHGRNGFGAWNYSGSSRLAESADANEQSNASDDLDDAFDEVFVDAVTSTTFDDVLSYRDKDQMVVDAELIVDDSESEGDGLCSIAGDSSTACDGSGTGCNDVLDAVYDICIE